MTETGKKFYMFFDNDRKVKTVLESPKNKICETINQVNLIQYLYYNVSPRYVWHGIQHA